MNAMLDWLNDPGPIQWIVDLVLVPVLSASVVYGLRSLYLRFALKDQQSDAARQIRRQTSRMLAFLVTVAAVTLVWRFRLQSLAGRADVTPQEREILVDSLGGAANAVTATAVLVFLLVILARAHRWAVHRLDAWKEARKGVQVQGTTLITPSRVRQFAGFSLRIVRFVLVLTLFYIYVPMLLSFIPVTRPLVGQVVPVALGPVRDLALAFLRYLPRLVSLLLIVAVMRFLSRVLLFFMDAVGKGDIKIPGFDPEWAEQTERLLRIVLILGAIMVIYPFLPGAGSEVFRGFSLFVGAVFTLGSSGSVNNMISGMILTYTGSFRIGERISVGETTGVVTTRGLFVTRLPSMYNEVVTVPNMVALSGRVVNDSAAQDAGGLVLSVTVGIGYDVDWRQIHELMKGAARETESILEEPEPIVLQTELAEFAVEYELRAWTDDPLQMVHTQSALRRNVLDAFNGAGVEIMTPSVNAIRNSLESTIPDRYVATSTTPPTLRFSSAG
jgi:small-conductance mechanosensitive channel